MSCSQTLLLQRVSPAFFSVFVQGEERRDRRRVRRLHTITLRTPLTTALRLLLESGCSSLPVLDEVRTCLKHMFEGRQGLLLAERLLKLQAFLVFALCCRACAKVITLTVMCVCASPSG